MEPVVGQINFANVPALDGKPRIQSHVGTQGPQGEQGLQGAVGPRGLPGEQGIQGEQGPQGIQGIHGCPGERGPVGPQGPEGIAGGQGLSGDAGPEGPQGVPGIRGMAGPQGIPGDKGEPGDIGNSGPQGDKGNPGPVGPQGDTGPVGPVGAMGPQGAAGISGTSVVVPETVFRYLNVNFQPSPDRLVWVCYTVSIDCKSTVGGGQNGSVELFSDDSFYPAVSRCRVSNSVDAVIDVDQKQEFVLCYPVAPGHYVRLVSSGSATIILCKCTEVTIS